MSLIDILQSLNGRQPERYNPQYDRATLPDPAREKTLKGHVLECGKRYIELRGALQDQAIEQWRQRRLLWIVIALLAANKVVDVSQFLP